MRHPPVTTVGLQFMFNRENKRQLASVHRKLIGAEPPVVNALILLLLYRVFSWVINIYQLVLNRKYKNSLLDQKSLFSGGESFLISIKILTTALVNMSSGQGIQAFLAVYCAANGVGTIIFCCEKNCT